MNSLVAYAASDSDSEDSHIRRPKKPDDRPLGASHHNIDPSQCAGPSKIKIKRPPISVKSHTRAHHVSEDLLNDSDSPREYASSTTAEPPPPPASITPSADVTPRQIEGAEEDMDIEDEDEQEEDELTAIRRLLRPPDIPGLKDWGIPPESDKTCDPAIATKLLQFHALKSGSTPKHFNDSLMSNQSFHNPHLYAKLVEFVDIGDEGMSCYRHHTATSPTAWDGLFGHGEETWDWDAAKIAQFQKTREQQSHSSSSSSQRKQIDFTSAKHKDKEPTRSLATTASSVVRRGGGAGGKEKDHHHPSAAAGGRYNPYIPDRSGQKWQGRWG